VRKEVKGSDLFESQPSNYVGFTMAES